MIVQALKETPRNRRMTFLPRVHRKLYLTLENTLYNVMENYTTEYQGGYWEFYEGANGVMIPMLKARVFENAGGQYSCTEVENIRSEYLSVVAWMFTLSAVCSKYEDERLADLYHAIRDWFYDQWERVKEYKETADSPETIEILDQELEQFAKAGRLID